MLYFRFFPKSSACPLGNTMKVNSILEEFFCSKDCLGEDYKLNLSSYSSCFLALLYDPFKMGVLFLGVYLAQFSSFSSIQGLRRVSHPCQVHVKSSMSLGYSSNSQNTVFNEIKYFLGNTKTQSSSFSHECTEYELFIDIVSDSTLQPTFRNYICQLWCSIK